MCRKRRHLADWFFAIENLIRLFSLFRLDIGCQENTLVDTVYKFTANHLGFAIGTRLDIFIGVSNFLLHQFIGMHLVYRNPLSNGLTVIYLLTGLLAIIAAIIFNMVINYIVEINKKLRTAGESHISLLNGIHEGLLILSPSTPKKNCRFLFANCSA